MTDSQNISSYQSQVPGNSAPVSARDRGRSATPVRLKQNAQPASPSDAEKRIVNEFRHLNEKSKQLFNGIRYEIWKIIFLLR